MDGIAGGVAGAACGGKGSRTDGWTVERVQIIIQVAKMPTWKVLLRPRSNPLIGSSNFVQRLRHITNVEF